MNVLMAISSAGRRQMMSNNMLFASQRSLFGPLSLMQFSADTKPDGIEAGKDPRPEKNLNFSAFARRERNYQWKDQVKMLNKKPEELLKLKDEFTKIPFDPNIRHRLDDMDNTLIWHALKGTKPDYEP